MSRARSPIEAAEAELEALRGAEREAERVR
jgi:hypothetical protein